MGRRALSKEEIDELLHDLADTPEVLRRPQGNAFASAPSRGASRETTLHGASSELSPSRSDEVRREPNANSLVAILLQAVDGLHLHEEPAEAARYLLRLARWAIHPKSGWVLVADARPGHFVVLAGLGPEAVALERHQTRQNDLLLSEAQATGAPVIVNQPASDARTQSVRMTSIPAERSVLCAPAMSRGQCVGALELVDPVNFEEFSLGHLRAAGLIASALGRYWDERIDASDEGTGPRRRPS